MNKIGVESTGLNTKWKTLEELCSIYKVVKDAGFDCIDFNLDEYLDVNSVEAGHINDVFERPIEEIWKDFEPHYIAASKNGLTFEQMHAPFPLIIKDRDDLTKRMHDITVKTFDICHRMGGKYIVVHPVTMSYELSKEEEYDANMKMYKSLIPAAKEFDVVICLENMFVQYNYHLMEGICSDFADAAKMIDELNEMAGEERFAFCFDVGHANILGKNLYQAVVTLGDRLKTLHIHDNDGVSDLHTMPFVFMRSWAGVATDWDGFLRGLKEIGYKGVINFETFRCMLGFPEELHPYVLKLLAQMGSYFDTKIH